MVFTTQGLEVSLSERQVRNSVEVRLSVSGDKDEGAGALVDNRDNCLVTLTGDISIPAGLELAAGLIAVLLLSSAMGEESLRLGVGDGV